MVAPGAECYMCLQVVDLRQCGTVKSADDLTNKPCSFTVQVPERTFYLVATSEAERNDWVASIGAPMPMHAPYRSHVPRPISVHTGSQPAILCLSGSQGVQPLRVAASGATQRKLSTKSSRSGWQRPNELRPGEMLMVLSALESLIRCGSPVVDLALQIALSVWYEREYQYRVRSVLVMKL